MTWPCRSSPCVLFVSFNTTRSEDRRGVRNLQLRLFFLPLIGSTSESPLYALQERCTSSLGGIKGTRGRLLDGWETICIPVMVAIFSDVLRHAAQWHVFRWLTKKLLSTSNWSARRNKMVFLMLHVALRVPECGSTKHHVLNEILQK